MSVTATVVFRRDGKDLWNRGTYEFLQLPCKGDVIHVVENGGVSNPEGVEDTFEVLFVEHRPATKPGEQPTVRIMVEWLSGRAG